MFSHNNPKENVGLFVFNIYFTQFRENLFCNHDTFIKSVFLGKLLFTHTFTFQPCYLITPIWRWYIYLHLQKIWTRSENRAVSSNAGRHCICWKSLGYWLTVSVWSCMTSRFQRPSERLAAILCLLSKGCGRRCGGLCILNDLCHMLQNVFAHSFFSCLNGT